MPRLLVCLVATISLSATAVVRAQPSLTHMSPGAIRPGQTTEVTLNGAKLDGSLTLWSSVGAKFEVAPIEADKKDVASRVCKVTLDANVPVGIEGLVVANAAGNSDVLYLMVDDLPSVADNGNNHAVNQAQAVTLPAAVDGASDGTAFDYYKFAAKKGERISVEVVAARLASPFDAVVRLLDASGRELLVADDDPSFGADARFSFSVPEDGEFVIEVRDNQFRGGGRYRIRIGDFPLVSSPYPLGGRFGSTMRFQFTGPLADSAAPVFLRIPDEGSLGRLSIAAKFPSGKSSAMATIVASQLPDVVESEPNNSRETATYTSLPCAMNGTLREPGDRDFYQFAATKGESMQFRAVSRSTGSPSYLFMRVYKSDGSPLGETPINDADETSVALTFPADGMYCLMVEDLLNRGGPEFGYRVEVEPNSGFTLTLKHDNNTRTKFALPGNGGAWSATVQVARRGFEGPIQLSLAGAATGFTLHDRVVPPKAKEHRVLVSAPAGVSPGALETIRLVGSATVNGRELRSTVQTTPTLRARLPQLAFPPVWIDGLFVVSIVADAPPMFNIASSANPIVLSRSQTQALFNVTLERKQEGFKENVTLLFEGLPSGFETAVKQEKDTYQVTIKGPKDAIKERRNVQIVAYGELKGSGRMVKLDVPLEVTD